MAKLSRTTISPNLEFGFEPKLELFGREVKIFKSRSTIMHFKMSFDDFVDRFQTIPINYALYRTYLVDTIDENNKTPIYLETHIPNGHDIEIYLLMLTF